MACGFGCSRGAPKKNTTLADLNTIARAYASATDELGHPPRSKEEFLPYLKAALAEERNPGQAADSDEPVAAADVRKVEDVMRSESDGEEFVIHWGVDYRGPRSLKAPVLAYEKRGKDGRRYVLQGLRPRSVKDEEFADLPFPPGFNPP
jgi:hypothetical protein